MYLYSNGYNALLLFHFRFSFSLHNLVSIDAAQCLTFLFYIVVCSVRMYLSLWFVILFVNRFLFFCVFFFSSFLPSLWFTSSRFFFLLLILCCACFFFLLLSCSMMYKNKIGQMVMIVY